jgi:Ca2+-binding EF-hand superfamily protein/HEAT repeat protein
MRFATFLAVSVALALVSTAAEPTQAQPGGKGGFGGKADIADKLFDLIAKGADPIATANFPASLQPALQDFAKAAKIENGMITRQQFQAMYEIMQLGGGGPNKGLDIDAAAAEKFRRYDLNADGRLNQDEMPPALRAALKKYDKNGDGFIDLEEFKPYFRDSLQLTNAPVASLPPKTEKTPDAVAEEVLREAGLGTDGEALLEFFRQRTGPKADLDELTALVRQLGDPDPPTRSRAVAKVLTRGPWAVPALRKILTSLDDAEAAPLARHCLAWLEGPRRGELPANAAQLLVTRKPAEAAALLLAYLPLAENAGVVDAVKAALDRIAARPGPLDAALLAALNDELALRRVVAVEVLAASNRPEVLPELRKVMAKAPPQVKLRAALALARQLDEQAVTVLIDLLAELPATERTHVEEALKQLAGEWSPNPNLQGDDELSRRIRREAWVSWWKALDGPALLAAFRHRTLTRDDAVKAQALVAQLSDKSAAKREQASAELTALGPKVVGLLREAAKSGDTEQARRAEKCLKEIAQQESKGKLPLAAPRLLALRRPAGATAALLAYLPFTDDSAMKEEVIKAAQNLVRSSDAAAAEVLPALADERPAGRQVAAEILVGAGGDKHKAAVRKLLTDADPAVRLRVAVLLVRAQDRETVPALIDLVADLPREQTREAEEILYRLAGNKAPAVSPSGNRTAWQSWWKDHGVNVNLAVLESAPQLQGPYLMVVAEVSNDSLNNPFGGFGKRVGIGPNKDRLVALDRKGQIQWQINNLDFPIDFQVLPGDRVLIAEYNACRVTERDLTGKILWEYSNLTRPPISVQRLPNGHTFIVLYHTPVSGGYMLEVDPKGTIVATIENPAGGAIKGNPLIRAAYKLPDGQIICVTSNDTCYRLDATGKEVKRFNLPLFGGSIAAIVQVPSFAGNLDVTLKNHIVVMQSDNTVAEYDLDGKQHWKTPATGNRATRLPSGNTLVASETGGLTELDNAGKMVWQYQPPAGYVAMRGRPTVGGPAGR